jgi:hypothetical protein
MSIAPPRLKFAEQLTPEGVDLFRAMWADKTKTIDDMADTAWPVRSGDSVRRGYTTIRNCADDLGLGDKAKKIHIPAKTGPAREHDDFEAMMLGFGYGDDEEATA